MEINETIDEWGAKERANIGLKVRDAQIQQLYHQTWGGLVGALFIAVSVSVILWQALPHWKLSLWVGVLVLLTILRGILVVIFQRKAPCGADIKKWARLHVAGVIASGMIWAVPTLFLWPENSPVHQLVWPICISALSATAVAKYCIWTPSYASFLCLSMVPLSLRLLAEGGLVYSGLGILGLVFIGILAQTGKMMHAAHLQALAMGLHNEALSSFLSDGKAKVEALNLRLQQEIAERTHSQHELGLRNQELERLNTQLTATKDNLESANNELELAVINIRRLSGLLPICASCKKIRNDSGYWEQIEAYLHEHAEVEFSHGICPDCARKLYPDYFKEIKKS
jgi:hypothetical protein